MTCVHRAHNKFSSILLRTLLNHKVNHPSRAPDTKIKTNLACQTQYIYSLYVQIQLFVTRVCVVFDRLYVGFWLKIVQ